MPKCAASVRKQTQKKQRGNESMMWCLRRFGGEIFDAVEQSRDELFACPVCRNVLVSPVTVDCGHTYCARCLDGMVTVVCGKESQGTVRRQCVECLVWMSATTTPATNVLVQEIVEKWRSLHDKDGSKNDHQIPRASDILGVEPRYRLRSRNAGLQPLNGYTDDYIYKIIRKLLVPTTRTKRNRKNLNNDCKLLHYIRSKRYSYVSASATTTRSNQITKADVSSAGRSIERILTTVQLIRTKALRHLWQPLLLPPTTSQSPPHSSSPHSQSYGDLECILCSRCLYDPLTTACGHTYCRDCLARVLDHNPACPLCMAPVDRGLMNRGGTHVLSEAARVVLPTVWRERGEEREREIGGGGVVERSSDAAQVPVFVCTTAFPGVACPLFVYVPRYRLLARRCLQSSTRRFAMAARLVHPPPNSQSSQSSLSSQSSPLSSQSSLSSQTSQTDFSPQNGPNPTEYSSTNNNNSSNGTPTSSINAEANGASLGTNGGSSGRFASYGTILEVRDAVHLKDGRSILTTVGVRRFQVLEKGEQDGYDTARVRYIRDSHVPCERLSELHRIHSRVHRKAARWVRSLSGRLLTEVESCIGRMPPLEEDWYKLDDGPAWAWWLMPILPLSTHLQVGFLSTTCLEKRLRAIEKMLEHMKIRMRALDRGNLKFADPAESENSCRLHTWMLSI